MKFRKSWLLLPLVLGMFAATAVAQQNQSNSIVQEAFLPFDTGDGDQYRSASGDPGPEYWQNRADYSLEVRLHPESHTVESTVLISYTNNSPESLEQLWIQLDQDLFAQNSWGAKLTPYGGSRFGNRNFDGGFDIRSIEVAHNGTTYRPERHKVDTNLKLNLKEALSAGGGSLTVTIDYRFKIPRYGSDRMGRVNTRNGWIYEIAQWYPRMAVYDDLAGWNVRPYLGTGEFYLEYGSFDVMITAPAEFTVVASGELLNREEVLTDEQLKRWSHAEESEERVYIVNKEEVGTPAARPGQNGLLTWRYRIKNARDVAWAASRAFIWDAARINLPGEEHALAMSVYPIESAGENAWGRSTEYVKGSVESLSKRWYPYPYPVAINVAGIVGGMEYPSIVFCSWKATGSSLWGVTNHEFAHTWFPMIVGSNERKYAWMDEGLTTFIQGYSTIDFNNGEYEPSRTDVRGITDWMNSENHEAIMTLPDQVQQGNLGEVAYYKPAIGLRMLRETIIGPELFDEAFREYIDRWAYKHPTPNDFFNTMENVTGHELDWFWRGWFKEIWTLDQAVESVSYVEGDPANGALVTISNKNKLVMPVIMKVRMATGNSRMVNLPVQVWQRGNSWTVKMDTSEPVDRVELDPDGVFPDIDRSNNILNRDRIQKDSAGSQ
ncbi:MAG: M1 family metallopeptidase [Balneolaceae bacterium]|nr:M1 family metallopeptidase [Balneolaceae bacterium]